MNCKKGISSEINSVVFKTDPPNRWTTETSRKWLADHDIERLNMKNNVVNFKVDKTKNSLRYRIVDPACFKSFSTEVVESEMGTINLVIGWYVNQPKGKKKSKGGVATRISSSRFKPPKKKKKVKFRSRKRN